MILFVLNKFETFYNVDEAAQVLGIKRAGLANLCVHYNLQHGEEYKKLKAIYQQADWRKRPLSPPMLEYGRYDVHYL